MMLSKSAIEKFRSCRRCFHLDKIEKIKSPDGIRAGVPMGIDRTLKNHYDLHRLSGTIPPELIGKIPGGLYDGKKISMADLRNWRKGLSAKIGDGDVFLTSAMDDLLYDPTTKLYNVFDAKSKAKLTNIDDTEKFYGIQAAAYDLVLNVNGYPTDGNCYFAYYRPEAVLGSHKNNYISYEWGVQVITIKADHERIKKLVMDAAACLNGPLPAPSESCEMCAYVNSRAQGVEVKI